MLYFFIPLMHLLQVRERECTLGVQLWMVLIMRYLLVIQLIRKVMQIKEKRHYQN